MKGRFYIQRLDLFSEFIHFCRLGTKSDEPERWNIPFNDERTAEIISHDVIEHTSRQRTYFLTPVEEELMAIGGTRICRPQFDSPNDINNTIMYRLPKPCPNFKHKYKLDEFIHPDDFEEPVSKKDHININNWVALGEDLKLRQFNTHMEAQNAFWWLESCLRDSIKPFNYEETKSMHFVFDTNTWQFNYSTRNFYGL
jgi:hypothetical protein